MKKRKKKFSDIWVNQTNLGKHFGISSVAVGKKLMELGLRGIDKQPTKEALSREFCKLTPLKDGTPFYMWNKGKVLRLFQNSGLEQLPQEDMEALEITKNLIDLNKKAKETGIDKLFWMFIDDIPSTQYEKINYYLEKLGSDFRLNQ